MEVLNLDFSITDYAAFLAGDGNPQICEALKDPAGRTSRYFSAVSLTADQVDQIDLLELCAEEDEDDDLPALPANLRDALEELLGNVHPDNVHMSPDRQWNEVSRPLRLAYYTEFGRRQAQAASQHVDTHESPALETRLDSESTIPESDSQYVSEELLDSLREISSRAWQVHILAQFSGRSVDEIAELTGESVEAVAHIAGLARVTLDQLSEDAPDAS